MISQERLKLEVKLRSSANRMSYTPRRRRRLAQQWMTLSDLEWPHHTLSLMVAELLVGTGIRNGSARVYAALGHTI